MTPRCLPAHIGSPNEYMRSVDNIQGGPVHVPHMGVGEAIRAVRPVHRILSPFHRIKLYHLSV